MMDSPDRQNRIDVWPSRSQSLPPLYPLPPAGLTSFFLPLLPLTWLHSGDRRPLSLSTTSVLGVPLPRTQRPELRWGSFLELTQRVE